jgi:glycosyltransferase involved in cell wall biosynthesis
MPTLFVVPDLDGPRTGGTLYNLQLMAALSRRGALVEQSSLSAATGRTDCQLILVDSLFLNDLPLLRAAVAAPVRVGVLLHYLPSLVRDATSHLSAEERRALSLAEPIVAPSSTLVQHVLRELPAARIACVEPGTGQLSLRSPERRTAGALMLCNVTENKGVLPFLRELASLARADDTWTLEIAGCCELEPDYGRAARAAAEGGGLRDRVRFLGSIGAAEVSARLADSRLFVSASRMESYGMALAEARAHGTPILAREGGHVAAHVSATHGGELVRDEVALARAFVALWREPARLRERLALAWNGRVTRSWDESAREFLEACYGVGSSS